MDLLPAHGLQVSTLALLSLLAAAVLTAGADAPPLAAGRFEEGGISVDFSLTPLDADGGAVARFRVRDVHTGQPLSGLHPLAWMTGAPAPGAATADACRARTLRLLDGGLADRAGVDLNSFLLLTLNGDRTVSFINPQVAFRGTQLESIVELPAAGADWLLAADGNTLWVTLPEAGAVAVIDTATRKLAATLPLGAGSRPGRIALDPDGQAVWVALDGAAAVAVIDPGSRQAVARIAVGDGEHRFAFSADSRFAFVANRASGSVTVIDAFTRTRRADVAIGGAPVALAWGEKSRRLYVAGEDEASIAVIDPQRPEEIHRIPAAPGIAALRFEPEGRFALVLNRRDHTLRALDTANGAFTAEAAVMPEPAEIAFTRDYVYVRSPRAADFALFGLAELRQGRLSKVTVQAGTRPPQPAPGDEGPAPLIVPAPDGSSVFVANPAEKMAYYYQEGLMVPMGTLPTYSRTPLGLLVLDHSLREVAPGVYAAPVRLTRGGAFDVPLLLDQPRLLHCFTAALPAPPAADRAAAHPAVEVQPLFDGVRAVAGEPVRLAFRILDAASRQPVAGLADVRALALEPPGNWQRRAWATEAGGGVYRVEWVFPRAGVYKVGVSVASRGLSFAGRPFTDVHVEAPLEKKRGAR